MSEEKNQELACHVVNSNIAIGSLPTIQTSHGLLALFEKIYYGEPIFTDFSNIGEDVQYRCFNSVYDVKSTSQPDTKNRVRGAVLCLTQDGACTNLFENFSENS